MAEYLGFVPRLEIGAQLRWQTCNKHCQTRKTPVQLCTSHVEVYAAFAIPVFKSFLLPQGDPLNDSNERHVGPQDAESCNIAGRDSELRNGSLLTLPPGRRYVGIAATANEPIADLYYTDDTCDKSSAVPPRRAPPANADNAVRSWSGRRTQNIRPGWDCIE